MSWFQGVWVRRSASIAIIVACWLLYAPPHAQANPLGLTTSSPGDVTSSSLDVAYDHTSGVLTANGSSDGFHYSVLDDADYFLTSPAYTITANLNPANGALISGTIEIDGDDTGFLGLYSGTLLTGNLTAFGFPNPPGSTDSALEFTFQITGGLLADPGGPYYSTTNVISGGTILEMQSPPTNYFASGWPTGDFNNHDGDNTNIHNTVSDTFPIIGPLVPEPSTFVLLALGLLPLAWRLR